MSAAAPTPPRKRPELGLGPMTGTPEYIQQRAEALVRAFAGLLDVPEIKLIDCSGEGGRTDCHSTIWAPFQDPEGYLVTEHELSHWLFETDVVMADRFVDKLASKLLNAAGIQLGTDQALPYEKQLKAVVHHLWNVLEDWRCRWLWAQLYVGGGELLRQRWEGICKYEVPEEAARKSLLQYLKCFSVGAHPAGVPQDFIDCERPLRRALNLAEGVDAVACLAITGRLVAEISDALLANHPLPPPPQSGGGGGKGQQQGGGGQGQNQQQGQGGGPPQKPQTPQQQQQAARKEKALHIVKLLAGVTPRGSAADGTGDGGIGTDDLAQPPAKERTRRENRSSRMAEVDRLLQLESKETDESGTTPFQSVLAQGADAMEGRLEEARNAMLRRQDSSDDANTQICLGWSQEAGIPIIHVVPTRDLVGPTITGYENRRILEQLRMKKRRKRDFEGEFNADGFLSALGAGELDRPFYDKTVRVPRFELLFLFDVSGSMTIGQALPLTERALADSVFAVTAIKSKAHMWAFSDVLYMFDRIGSPTGISAIRYGSTSMVQALDVAHKWGKKAPTKRAIMLVTDGWPTSCRAKNSTGDPLKDLHAVLTEMREDKLPISVLGIRHAGMAVEATRQQYDVAFGLGGYGMVTDFTEMAAELPKAVRILASAHVQKGLTRV